MNILYEDDYLLAINKSAGLLSVAAGNKIGLIDQLKKERQNTYLRQLNRLDRDSSGIILFAKTKECFTEAVEKRKYQNAKKTYLAIIEGKPKFKQGLISFPLASRRDSRQKVPAQTHYRIIKTFRNFSLAEAKIHQGRFHQIRKHFSMIGHPLVVDFDYQNRDRFREYRKNLKIRHFLLHCKEVEFKHFVTGKNIKISCPPPREFSSFS